MMDGGSCTGSGIMVPSTSGRDVECEQRQLRAGGGTAEHAQGSSLGGGEAAGPAAACGGAEQPEVHRTHHLLKHCLSNDQKGEALQYFNTNDVKEAAKDISRMGQRELQSKFKVVYGSVTHSNNNDWLRRKLYEAIGAAPLKSATKGKARKVAGASKPRKSVDSALGGHGHAHAHGHAGAERRRRSHDAALKSSPAAPALTAAARLKRGAPSSPRLGGSVLDLHRFSSHDTLTSESEDGSREHLEDLHHHSTDCDTPRSSAARAAPFGPFGAGAPFAGAAALPVHMRPARTHVGLVPVRPLGGAAAGLAPAPAAAAAAAYSAPGSPPRFIPHSLLPTGMHQAVVEDEERDLVRQYTALSAGQPGSLSHALAASRSSWAGGLAGLQAPPPAPPPLSAPLAAPLQTPQASAATSWQPDAMWQDLADMSLELKGPVPGADDLAPAADMTDLGCDDDDVQLLQLDLSAFDNPACMGL
eukprot:scaffold18.g1904.t1